MKKCAIESCSRGATKRGVTCGPKHAQELRKLKQSNPSPQEESLAIEEEHRLKKEVKSLKARLGESLETRVKNEDYEAFVSRVVLASSAVKDASWMRPASSNGHSSILVTSLSDIHAEETVNPEVMNWVNGYDLSISKKRVENFFTNICKVAFDDLKGIKFKGIVINLLGDMITGWIHEELAQSNGTAPMEACVMLSSWLRSGIRLLSRQFGYVFIPCVIGNHGRMTHKQPHKNPTTSSFDWLIYAMLQDAFSEDKRVIFQVPKSPDTFYKVFDYRFCIEHGNNFKGGSNAISGIYPSIALGNYRKKNVEQAVGNPFDYLWIGDKHQLKFLGSIFINGSVIGYNEYARDMKFGFEKPQQQFAVIDPIRGATIKGEIFVESKDEPWMRSPARIQ